MRSHRQPMYVMHPGVVRTRADGQCHYVSASRLAELYGLAEGRWQVYESREHNGEPPPGWYYVHLFPREDGVYRVPESVEG